MQTIETLFIKVIQTSELPYRLVMQVGHAAVEVGGGAKLHRQVHCPLLVQEVWLLLPVRLPHVNCGGTNTGYC